MKLTLVLVAVLFVCNFCLIHAARLHHQFRLPVKILSSSSSAVGKNSSFSMSASSSQYSASPQQNNISTVFSATTLESASVFSEVFLNAIDRNGSLGLKNRESTLFRTKCKRFCESRSKRTCRHAKRPNTPSHCPPKSFLGFKRAPTCCFYLHCISSYLPVGRRRKWWKHNRVRHAIRSACNSTLGNLVNEV